MAPAASSQATFGERLAAADSSAALETLARELILAADDREQHDPARLFALIRGAAALAGTDLPRESWEECFDALRAACEFEGHFQGPLELVYAHALMERGFLLDAVQVVNEALEELPDEDGVKFYLQHTLLELLRTLQRWEDALDLADSQLAALEEAQAHWSQSTRRSQVDWYELFSGTLGSKAEIMIQLGLLDRAAVTIALETRCVLELKQRLATLRAASEARGSSGAARGSRLDELGATERALPRIQARSRCYSSELWLASERFSKVVEACRPAPGDEALPASLQIQLSLGLGLALAEEERGQELPESEAAGLLAGILKQPELQDITRVRVHLALADLALRRREWAAATSSLSRVRELTAELGSLEVLADSAALDLHEAVLALETQPERLEDSRARLRARYRELLASWGRTPRRAGGVGFLQLRDRTELLSTLLRVELALADSAREAGASSAMRELEASQAAIASVLEEWLRGEGESTLVRDLPARPVDLASVRSALITAGHGILVFLPAKERSHLILIDEQGLLHQELVAPDRMKPLSRAFAQRLAVSPAQLSDEAQREALAAQLWQDCRGLSELLLPDSIRARMSSWRSASFVGLGMLSEVPPGCLSIEPQRLLGTTLALDVLPSLTAAVHWAQQPAPARGAGPRLTLIADLSPPPGASLPAGESVQPIPIDARQIARLTEPFGAGGARVLQGSEVTFEALSALDYSRSAITHFLVHGLNDAQRERGAALVVRGAESKVAELWRAESIEETLHPASELVILSACGAARGPARMGDDHLTHLGGAFLRAGARAVVLSRAQLEFRRTMQLMERLHEELSRSESTLAQAMMRARGWRVEQGDALDPFLDGQVEVVGFGQLVLR